MIKKILCNGYILLPMNDIILRICWFLTFELVFAILLNQHDTQMSVCLWEWGRLACMSGSILPARLEAGQGLWMMAVTARVNGNTDHLMLSSQAPHLLPIINDL